MNLEAEILRINEQIRTLFRQQEEMKEDMRTFHNLVIAVERIANKTEANTKVLNDLKNDLKSDVTSLKADVKELKEVPTKRYENTRQNIVNAILTAIIGAVVGIVIGYFSH